MKSYLSGNPEIRLALNEELGIGRSGRSIYGISPGLAEYIIELSFSIQFEEMTLSTLMLLSYLSRVRGRFVGAF